MYLLCLISFVRCHALRVHPCCGMSPYFTHVLFLDDAVLSWIDRILLIHSSFVGHVGSFHSLVWPLWRSCYECLFIGFWINLCFHFSWVYSLERNCLAVWILCLTFWGTARLFSKMAVTIPAPMYEHSSFSIYIYPHQRLLSFPKEILEPLL